MLGQMGCLRLERSAPRLPAMAPGFFSQNTKKPSLNINLQNLETPKSIYAPQRSGGAAALPDDQQGGPTNFHRAGSDGLWLPRRG